MEDLSNFGKSQLPISRPFRSTPRHRESTEFIPKRVSRFCGVTWNRKNQRWRADIRVDGRLLFLGLFESESEAAIAFDIAAVRNRGVNAVVNFPDRMGEIILKAGIPSNNVKSSTEFVEREVTENHDCEYFS